MLNFNDMSTKDIRVWIDNNRDKEGTQDWAYAKAAFFGKLGAAKMERPVIAEGQRPDFTRGGYLGIDEGGALTPPPETSPLEAGILGAGRTFRSFATGAENLFADEAQQQEIAARQAEQDRLFGLVRGQHPTESFIGEMAPYFAPSGIGTGIVSGGLQAAAAVPKLLQARGATKGLLGASRAIRNSPMLDAALMGAGYGLLTPGEDQVEQAGISGALGAAGDIAGRAVGRVFNPVQSTLSRQTKKIVDWAKSKGYTLTPGQQFGSKSLSKVEDSARSYPPTAAPFDEAAEHNQVISNRIAANSIGETAEELSADVLDNAHKRLGARFDELTKDVEIPLSLDDGDLMSIIRRKLEEFDIDPSDEQFQKIINKILPKAKVMPFPRKIKPGDILTGAQYQKFRSAASRKASSAFKRGEVDEGFAAAAVVDALDEITERALGGQALKSFRKVRQQWRNKLALESPGVIDAGTGNVSPATLANVLNRTDKSGFLREANVGGNDLYAMARSGKLFKSIADSGTASRLFVPGMAGMGLLLGGGLGGEDLGEKAQRGALGLAGGALAGVIAPRLASRAYMASTPAMTNALRRVSSSVVPKFAQEAIRTGVQRGVPAQYLYEPKSTSERKLGLLDY